jgi:hypothetical protein
MNIISRIFNAIAPGATTPTATASAPGTPSVTPEGYRAANRGTKLEDWQIKFSLYFPESSWRGNEFLAFHRPVVPQKLVKQLLNRAGEIFNDADVSKLRELHADQTRIHAKLEELNFWASTKIYLAQQETAAQKILDSNLSEVPPLRSKKEIREGIGRAREALHVELVRLGEAVFNILAPACDRLRAVARDMAEAQDAKERAVHDGNCGDEMPFVPSGYLKTLAFLALHSCDAPVRNFYLTKRLNCPDPYKLLEIWFPPVSVLPARPAPQSDAENPALKERRDRENAARDEKHKAALADKNEMVSKIQKIAQLSNEEREQIEVDKTARVATKAASVPETKQTP